MRSREDTRGIFNAKSEIRAAQIPSITWVSGEMHIGQSAISIIPIGSATRIRRRTNTIPSTTFMCTSVASGKTTTKLAVNGRSPLRH